MRLGQGARGIMHMRYTQDPLRWGVREVGAYSGSHGRPQQAQSCPTVLHVFCCFVKRGPAARRVVTAWQ